MTEQGPDTSSEEFGITLTPEEYEPVRKALMRIREGVTEAEREEKRDAELKSSENNFNERQKQKLSEVFSGALSDLTSSEGLEEPVVEVRQETLGETQARIKAFAQDRGNRPNWVQQKIPTWDHPDGYAIVKEGRRGEETYHVVAAGGINRFLKHDESGRAVKGDFVRLHYYRPKGAAQGTWVSEEQFDKIAPVIEENVEEEKKVEATPPPRVEPRVEVKEKVEGNGELAGLEEEKRQLLERVVAKRGLAKERLGKQFKEKRARRAGTKAPEEEKPKEQERDRKDEYKPGELDNVITNLRKEQSKLEKLGIDSEDLKDLEVRVSKVTKPSEVKELLGLMDEAVRKIEEKKALTKIKVGQPPPPSARGIYAKKEGKPEYKKGVFKHGNEVKLATNEEIRKQPLDIELKPDEALTGAIASGQKDLEGLLASMAKKEAKGKRQDWEDAYDRVWGVIKNIPNLHELEKALGPVTSELYRRQFGGELHPTRDPYLKLIQNMNDHDLAVTEAALYQKREELFGPPEKKRLMEMTLEDLNAGLVNDGQLRQAGEAVLAEKERRLQHPDEVLEGDSYEAQLSRLSDLELIGLGQGLEKGLRDRNARKRGNEGLAKIYEELEQPVDQDLENLERSGEQLTKDQQKTIEGMRDLFKDFETHVKKLDEVRQELNKKPEPFAPLSFGKRMFGMLNRGKETLGDIPRKGLVKLQTLQENQWLARQTKKWKEATPGQRNAVIVGASIAGAAASAVLLLWLTRRNAQDLIQVVPTEPTVGPKQPPTGPGTELPRRVPTAPVPIEPGVEPTTPPGTPTPGPEVIPPEIVKPPSPGAQSLFPNDLRFGDTDAVWNILLNKYNRSDLTPKFAELLAGQKRWILANVMDTITPQSISVTEGITDYTKMPPGTIINFSGTPAANAEYINELIERSKQLSLEKIDGIMEYRKK